jgi:hypothetical protein
MVEEPQNQQRNNDEIILNTSNEHTSVNVSVEETVAKVSKMREKNKFLRIFLFSIIGFIVLIISFFIVYGHLKKMNQVTYNNEYPLYQYFAGAKNEYTGKVTISKDKDITTIKNDDGVVGIEDAPIYFQKVDNEVLVTKNMLLVFPRLESKNYKISLFTKLMYDKESDASFYYQGEKKIFLEESFLYDGRDLYLFLYKTSVQVGETVYELSPLSYVIVNYDSQVEIYDKEKDKYYIIENVKTDVIGTLGSHKINMSIDMVNDNRLLLKSVSELPLYKN